MDAEQELILHIDPGSATIKLESRSPEGSIITKRIGYHALVECIKGSLQREMAQSGLLPTGCISFDAGSDGWRYVALEHPARYADITYGNTVYPHFPLPRLVFRFGLHMGLRVQNCQMGVVAEGRLTPDTPHVPLPLFQCQRLSPVYRREYPAGVQKPAHPFLAALPDSGDAQQR